MENRAALEREIAELEAEITQFRQRGVDLLDRIALTLADIDAASKPSDIDLPEYRLRPLRDDLQGWWSILISGNWRITFRFEDDNIYDIDLVDYH